MKNIIKLDILITCFISILFGSLLSILQGTHVINIGWFWATIPFWLIPTVNIVEFISLFIAFKITNSN